MPPLAAGLDALKNISGTEGKKSLLKKLAEYLVIGLMIYGVYADASANLTTAKTGGDEQLKGYAVQMGYTRTAVEQVRLQEALDSEQIKDLTKENEQLREWLKALSARVNRLEDIAIRRAR